MKNLLKQLIQSAPTAQTGEAAAGKALQNFFRLRGIEAALDIWDNRANVTARLHSAGEKPPLIFAAHLDVVPAEGKWNFEPFAGIEQDGRIYGRGATDMLGGLAAAAAAMAEVAASGAALKGDCVLFAAAGEETDSCGAMRFLQRNPVLRPAGIILPEPTHLRILTAHRGILWLKITTHGKSAHGSMPKLGINAIEKMNALLARIFAWSIPAAPHPDLGGCSLSVNRISGGTATNIVPDQCTAELDIRTLPGQSQEAIIDELRQIIGHLARHPEHSEGSGMTAKSQEAADTEVSIIRKVDGLETDPQCEFVRQVCSAAGINKTGVATFTTDGPHFRPLSENIIIFGPGRPEMCHKPDEFIEIEQLETVSRLYQQIIRHLMM